MGTFLQNDHKYATIFYCKPSAQISIPFTEWHTRKFYMNALKTFITHTNKL